MAARRLLLSVLVIVSLLASALLAQDQTAPEVANAKYEFAGVVNANSVYVRSGPGDNYYPTLKLDKGAPITVVGMKFDWLKIVPPEGSFCYVAKAYIEKRGDGSVGRVTRPDLNVRAGSSLNAMKTTVQTKLAEGTDVQIVGEQDEYFMIKPPQGAYLYVNKQYVDPVRAIAGPGIAAAPAPAETETPAAPAPDATTSTEAVPAPVETAPVVATVPAEARFEQLEAEFAANNSKPVEEQPVADLLKGYQELVADAQLPESMKRIADNRIATLKLRADAKEQLLAFRKAQQEVAERQKALAAEKVELEERLKASGVAIYTAVGTLQTSSLQTGPQTLYRLIDPNTGRTLVYIRSGDQKVVINLGNFVGVRGEVVNDQTLGIRFITPTDIQPVDISRVQHGVTAQIVPPSLLTQGATTNP